MCACVCSSCWVEPKHEGGVDWAFHAIYSNGEGVLSRHRAVLAGPRPWATPGWGVSWSSQYGIVEGTPVLTMRDFL